MAHCVTDGAVTCEAAWMFNRDEERVTAQEIAKAFPNGIAGVPLLVSGGWGVRVAHRPLLSVADNLPPGGGGGHTAPLATTEARTTPASTTKERTSPAEVRTTPAETMNVCAMARAPRGEVE